MSQVNGLEELNAFLRQLADAVYQTATTAMGRKKWRSAVLDVRYDRSGKSWLSKIRVATAVGKPVSIKMNAAVQLPLEALNPLRGSLSIDEWYGLLLEISPKRQVKIDLSYDPRCSEDESFFAN